MFKETLKEKEPTAYLSLYNDLKNKHISHSYLFFGELNHLKTEAAFLLAQSIIENNENFACEECNTCKRIKEGNYYDVIYVDGYNQTIKKEDIENIFSEFNRTSLEASGKKVYIISNVNNASLKALNMILKFMEEPNDNTFGIFISDNIDDLLPTIVSRCKKVPFLTRDYKEIINKYIENNIENDDAYLIANVLHIFNPEFQSNDLAFQTAKNFVYQTIDNMKTPSEIPYMYINELYNAVEKENFDEFTKYYLDIMIIMLDDAIANKFLESEIYDKYINKLQEIDTLKLLEVFIDAKNKYSTKVDRKLLFDQIAYKIISYMK